MIKQFIVESQSIPNRKYIVRYFPEAGRFVCVIQPPKGGREKPCPSYAFGKRGFECRHIQLVKEMLARGKV